MCHLVGQEFDLLGEVSGLGHGDESPLCCLDLARVKFKVLESSPFLDSSEESDDVGETSGDFLVAVPFKSDAGILWVDEIEPTRLSFFRDGEDSRLGVCLSLQGDVLDFFIFFNLEVDCPLGPFGRRKFQKRSSFPPDFGVSQLECGDLPSSHIGRILFAWHMEPLPWLSVGLNFPDAVRDESFESFGWGINPMKRDHGIGPVEALLGLDAVNFLNGVTQPGGHDASDQFQT